MDTSSNEMGTKFPNKWLGKFARQELQSKWKPTPSKEWTIGFYLVVAAVFLAVGSFFLSETLKVVEYKHRYDDKGMFADMTSDERFDTLERLNVKEGQGKSLTREERDYRIVTFDITTTKDMEAPVYVYYEVSNYFQNHKRYVRSLDSQQMGGEGSGDPTTACDPKRMLDDKPIFPCGLIASSLFNDTYDLSIDETKTEIDGKGISWEWDRKYLYGDGEAKNFNLPKTRDGGTIVGALDKDERFMVWMRVAAAPTARKLYGRIQQNIPKGSVLTFTASNNYNTYKFTGKKSIVISTANWTGGRNRFTGIVYIVVGCLAAVAALSFFLNDLRVKRPTGDLNHLSWVKKNT
ncbi:hypothetical protein BSKO_05174 [Bryopsis sp. KO-2023]|nr:hypothetical protein BSKO_05174 [Bryopsis sp. KO-2023]